MQQIPIAEKTRPELPKVQLGIAGGKTGREILHKMSRQGNSEYSEKKHGKPGETAEC